MMEDLLCQQPPVVLCEIGQVPAEGQVVHLVHIFGGQDSLAFKLLESSYHCIQHWSTIRWHMGRWKEAAQIELLHLQGWQSPQCPNLDNLPPARLQRLWPPCPCWPAEGKGTGPSHSKVDPDLRKNVWLFSLPRGTDPPGAMARRWMGPSGLPLHWTELFSHQCSLRR